MEFEWEGGAGVGMYGNQAPSVNTLAKSREKHKSDKNRTVKSI